jgi:hypothetical protein
MTKNIEEEQKKVADGVLRVLCISILMMGIGIMLFPMFFPLIAISKDVPGYVIGIIMSMSAVVSLISAPILNRYILGFGIERTILIVAFCFIGGFILCGVMAPIDNYPAFIGVNVVAMMLIGFAIAANTIGE